MFSPCTKHLVLAFKDEAGSLAYTQLFRLGDGVFRSIQLRTDPLRTLTLGVLIVSGGVLAALPFRRYQAIPDASSAPAQVTGPTQSLLDSSNTAESTPPDSIRPESISPESNQPDSNRTPTHRATSVLASKQSPWVQPSDEVQVVANSLAPRSVHVPVQRREVDIPLSFEDLAQPIVPPAPIERRFNAVASIREKQLERERVTGLVMPAMESLAVTQQEELHRVAASVSEEARQRAGATLASTVSRDTDVEPLPEAAAAARQRHWIRQPN